MPTRNQVERMILKLLESGGSTNGNKYNLVGRGSPGLLESAFCEAWSVEQRQFAAAVFDDLKRRGLIRPTMSDLAAPEDWVVITDSGKRFLHSARSAFAISDVPTVDDAWLEDATVSALERGQPVAIAYADLDHFKEVNDTQGHDAGDWCIERFAQIIGSAVEGRGDFARGYACGDEFVIVLPNFKGPEAAQVCHRIRQDVKDQKISDPVEVTASFGVADSTEPDWAAPREIVSTAEGRMREAKRVRDTVVSLPVPAGHGSANGLLSEWIARSKERWASVVQGRVHAAHPLMSYPHGVWSFGYLIHPSTPCELALKSLEALLRDMPNQTRCLHPWRVPGIAAKRPYRFEGNLECWLADSDGAAADEFWLASPDLNLFCLSTYDEDQAEFDGHAPGTSLEFTMPIWRVGECVLHVARIRDALDLGTGHVDLAVVWEGLSGRRLASREHRRLHDAFTCHQPSVSAFATIELARIEENLSACVRKLTAPLYEAFSYDDTETLVDDELAKMVAKCAG